MVRNIRNIWILLQIRHKHTNEGAHLRRGRVPDLHWLCRRTPKSMHLAHALYRMYKKGIVLTLYTSCIMGCQLRSGCKGVPANTIYTTHPELVSSTQFRFPKLGLQPVVPTSITQRLNTVSTVQSTKDDWASESRIPIMLRAVQRTQNRLLMQKHRWHSCPRLCMSNSSSCQTKTHLANPFACPKPWMLLGGEEYPIHGYGEKLFCTIQQNIYSSSLSLEGILLF